MGDVTSREAIVAASMITFITLRLTFAVDTVGRTVIRHTTRGTFITTMRDIAILVTDVVITKMEALRTLFHTAAFDTENATI